LYRYTEAIAYVLPGLTKDERKFLGPIVLGSSVLFYAGGAVQVESSLTHSLKAPGFNP
jgi:hypothetical protein